MYTDADRARVYVVLTTNEGNVKRTARETGVPENTVRRWKKEWQQNGPPSLDDVEEAAGDFLAEAERVRWKALMALDGKIEQAKPSELITVIGVLDDKIARAKGLAVGKVEHVHTLPSPDEIRQTLGAALAGVLQAAKERQEEIIDAELVEQAPAGELPSAA